MRPLLLLFLFSLINLPLPTQIADYAKRKAEKLAAPSPFEKYVSGGAKSDVVYEDEFVVAFVPLRKQAPVHLLIVPRKRIPTLNDATTADAEMLAHLLFAGQKLAKQMGIAETGYRLALNTNENAGQSVFHLHLHLLGGMKLGPMVEQTHHEKP